MKSKAKVVGVALVVVAITSLLLYAPLTRALQSVDGQEPDIENFETGCSRRRWLKVQYGLWFLNHSEPVTVDGTVVALFKGMLVVETAEDQIRIHLPPIWTVKDELINRTELFESYLGSDDITIEALRADVIDRAGLNVYVLLGYEIIHPVVANAVLPFNIGN